ncbi:MAG TPA: hypothetical protein VKB19_05365, partial [Pedobacter sp.]|nr:hypothetical protein [Pedobacter sp.]
MRGKVFCLLICLLFATLQALYFRQIGLAPFPLLSFGILILLTSNVPNTKEDSNFLIIFYGIIFISIIVGVLNISYIPDSNYYFPRVLGWLLFPLSVIAFRKGYNQLDRQELFRAVSWVLAIHLFFFYLQNIVHTLNGQRLDFLVNITGEVQRTGATKLQEFKDSIRS